MAKEKTTEVKLGVLDTTSFAHHPHDKYAKIILQVREIALQIIEYVLDPEDFACIDLESLTLSNTTFIDETLKETFADICYVGKTKTGEPFRINFLFEHKSDKPDKSEESSQEQLNRYILNKRMEDRKQNRDLALTIPILLYHGSAALEKETPTTLFPKAPKNLLKYVPSFDYVILDISHLKDSEIEAIKFVNLRNIFLAFKYSRNEKYLAEHWKKVIIFAAQTVKNFPLNIIIKATFLYMVHVSQTVSKKSKNLDNELSPEEKGSLLPFIPEFLVDSFKKGKAEGIEVGMEVGMEKGMEKILLIYMAQNPMLSNKQIADNFGIEVSFVEQLRKKLK
jgi:Putative transposase, YhgA-like